MLAAWCLAASFEIAGNSTTAMSEIVCATEAIALGCFDTVQVHNYYTNATSAILKLSNH
jgi:hypothetical protein